MSADRLILKYYLVRLMLKVQGRSADSSFKIIPVAISKLLDIKVSKSLHVKDDRKVKLFTGSLCFEG